MEVANRKYLEIRTALSIFFFVKATIKPT